MKKKEHHDIESVLEEHVEPGRRGSGAPERREKKAVKKLRSKSKKKSKPKTKLPVSKVLAKEEPEEFSTEEEKQEFIEEQLEEIGEAIEEEVEEKLEEAEEKGEKKDEEPVAVFVKDKQTAKDISILRKAVANGFSTTQKNIVVFYERTADAGDRFKGLLYILLGLSIVLTASFVSQENLFTLVDFLKIMSRTLVGKAITIAIGVSFIAYGSRRLSAGLLKKLKDLIFPKPKPKFVQKKLV